MEQGPVLQARGYALGPVAAIAGQTRLAASVTGTQVPFAALQQPARRVLVILARH